MENRINQIDEHKKLYPIIKIVLAGEELSGKSYAKNKIVEWIKKEGMPVVSLDEFPTIPMLYSGETFDSFLARDKNDRRRIVEQVIQERINSEVLLINKAEDLSEKTKGPVFVVEDRPWWDGIYYLLKQDQMSEKSSVSIYEILSRFTIERAFVSYPSNVVPYYMLFSPLDEKSISVIPETERNKRPSIAFDYSQKGMKYKIMSYLNYYSFFYTIVNIMSSISENYSMKLESTLMEAEKIRLTLPPEIISEIMDKILELRKTDNPLVNSDLNLLGELDVTFNIYALMSIAYKEDAKNRNDVFGHSSFLSHSNSIMDCPKEELEYITGKIKESVFGFDHQLGISFMLKFMRLLDLGLFKNKKKFLSSMVNLISSDTTSKDKFVDESMNAIIPQVKELAKLLEEQDKEDRAKEDIFSKIDDRYIN